MLGTYTFGKVEGYNEIPASVLKLFSPLVKNPEKQIKYADEIVLAALKGNINLNAPFSIDAYEARIEQNNAKNVYHSVEKEVHILPEFCTDKVNTKDVPYGCISEASATASLAEQVKDAYESAEDDMDLLYAIKTIKSLQKTILVHEHIDLIGAIKEALSGIPQAIETLAEICDNNAVVSEQVYTILSSGKTVEEIFG